MIYQTVDLVAEEYSWMCPICGDRVWEVNFGDVVECCGIKYKPVTYTEKIRYEYEEKIRQIHKDFGCELMDPNGTIWDHAQKLQDKIDDLEEELYKLKRAEYIEKYSESDAHVEKCCDEAREEGYTNGLKCAAEIADQHNSIEGIAQKIAAEIRSKILNKRC
jgi:hypothetical protein